MKSPAFQLTDGPGALGRRGVLHTPHGDVPTPFFMPIATKGAVKTLSSGDLEQLGTPIVLSNTFHLMLRPGMDVMERLGGLHAFMGWKGAILTDSGGYQVFSLADRRKITEEGVEFASPIDGSRHVLTPESSIDIQRTLGSDMVMCFDDVIGLPASREDIRHALQRTTRWAERCKQRFEETRNGARNHGALLFGIIQGGTDADLRRESAENLLKIGFDGYAIGGLSVGEPFEDAIRTLDALMPLLPANTPRYFMGGAQPEQIVAYVERGVDMFDCVLPTRNARHGHLYRWVHTDLTRTDFYEAVNITNAKWRGSQEKLLVSPAGHASSAGFEDELSTVTMGYLHHLFDTEEMVGYRLATLNNLRFYLDLLTRLRKG
jgi:queuine tRNA-ribosyltransferase